MDNINETNNTELSIKAINVNGLKDSKKKRNKVFDWLKSQKTDITLIQENHSTHNTKLKREKNVMKCLFGTLAQQTNQLV